jgi:predicted AAA+ superfamily ATPase
MITRLIASQLARSKKSLLLLGPRQTGKSTLVSSLKPDITFNLAHEPTYLEFLRNPRELEERLAARPNIKIIFIDEVQRIPSLLNTLQALLDRPRPPQFLLTGSSARKLRRGHANLLPGRIHTYTLGPLVVDELESGFPLMQALSLGTLPGIWTESDSETARKTLRSYAGTYLKEEIQAEGLARNLEGFARFLNIAAAASGQFLDFSKLASAAQVPRQSAVRFFEILEDCLLVIRVDAFAKSAERRLVQHPRYYFFDVGVLNGLLGNFNVSADRRGSLFEHWVVTQIVHTAQARDMDIRYSTYRTESGAEVDLILEKEGALWAIEIKASPQIGSNDLRGLRSFGEYYGKPHRKIVLYAGDHRKRLGDIELWPWATGIQHLF